MTDKPELTEEDKKLIEETTERRNKLIEFMLQDKLARLNKLQRLVKEKEVSDAKIKEKSKKKRKADRKARRINRSK